MLKKSLYLLIVILLTGSVVELIFLLNNPQTKTNTVSDSSSHILMMVIVSCLLLLLAFAHKQIDKLKQQMDKEFYTLQKAAMIGSWDWDIKNKVIHFPETALKVMGIDEKLLTLSDREFFSLIYKPDRTNYVAALRKTIKHGEPYKVQMRCKFKTDSSHMRWLDSRGEIFFDENNQPYRMIGMHQDITPVIIQRQLQEQMNNIMQNIIEHEKLEQILSRICTAVNVIETSVYCVIYLTSEKTDKLVLHHGDNIPDVLKHILEGISIVDNDSELMKTLSQKDTLHIEKLKELPSWQSANQVSNTLNICSFYGQPLLSSNHVKEGAICLYLQDEDIPKEIISQILNISSKVTAVAIEGQHQTDSQHHIQQQLYHSQKMDSIGHLTGGIAHDFNNILGSIVGYTSLSKKIAAKQDNEKLKQFLNEVSIASKRARDLISQMMIFSRSEPSQNVPVDTVPIIKEVLQLIKSMLPSSITIQQQFDKNVDHININPIALHQVIMNILINAKDAILENVGTISIHLSQEKVSINKCDSCHSSYSGQFVCIEIRDSGSGIPVELIERIFDPFFTTKDIGRGTGMGLSVVHGIVHDSNGHIIVSTIADKGTGFKLYFPALDRNDRSDLIEAYVSKDTLQVGQGENILVVDDDIPLSLLFEEILTTYGYNVTRYDNSQLALEAFSDNPDKFQLVLSDQTMPFLTGDEMSKEILKLRPDVPIIICTGYSEHLNEVKALEIGINTLLFKPVDMYKLLDVINDILSQKINNEEDNVSQ